MNILRKFAWAALVVTSGLPASTVSRGDATPREDAQGAPPPDRIDTALAKAPGLAWPFPEAEEDLEDEFEGEGWSFWEH
jgi:hypothetical protein